MKKKDTQIMFRLTKEEKEDFKQICLEQDENIQRILRAFVKDFIKNHRGSN